MSLDIYRISFQIDIPTFITNRKGFLGQQLSERDESSVFLNSAYSEFCCLKLFWVLLQSKVPIRIGKCYRLDSRVEHENDGIFYFTFCMIYLSFFIHHIIRYVTGVNNASTAILKIIFEMAR